MRGFDPDALRFARRLPHERLKSGCMGFPAFEWWAIPTAGRRESLASVLAGGEAYFEDFGTPIKILLSSDRLEPPPIGNRQQRSASTEFFYCSKFQKERLAQKLSKRSGVDEPVVRFGLGIDNSAQDNYGGNQNAIHLLLKGQCALISDDDVHLRFSSPFSSNYSSYIAGPPLDERERFYPTRKDLLTDVLPQPLSIESLVVSAGSLPAPDGPTAIVAIGLYGDSGATNSNHLLFAQSPAILSEALRHRNAYSLARSSRELFRVADAAFVTPSRGFMSAIYAINNRLPTAPFLPWGRGSDRLFGISLGVLFGYSMARVAAAAYHAPPEPRLHSGAVTQVTPSDLATELLVAFAAETAAAPSSVSTLSRFGQFVSRWCESAAKEECQVSKLILARWTRMAVTLANKLCARETFPRFYVEDVERSLQHLEIAMDELGRSSHLNAELRRDLSSVDAIHEPFRAWGLLCSAWHELESAALASADVEEFAIN